MILVFGWFILKEFHSLHHSPWKNLSKGTAVDTLTVPDTQRMVYITYRMAFIKRVFVCLENTYTPEIEETKTGRF